MENNDLLTRKSLSLKMQVSERTIKRYESKGMPVLYIGKLPRYNYQDVLSWFINFKPKKS